jgi:acyl-CoA thioesterase FadM
VIVTVDYSTGKPVRVPDDVRQAVANLEGRDFGRG